MTASASQAADAAPPGGGDGFFRKAEGLSLGRNDKAAMAALAAKYHLEFVGPPID